MPPSESQRQAFRDKFRSLHHEAFQSFLEELLKALHGPGDFQRIRKTRGDGGLDGLVVSTGQVYQAFAPARIAELLDAKTAAKIRQDFATACGTMDGRLQKWAFVHNHPEAAIGKRTAAALSELRHEHPTVEIRIHDIDSLWRLLADGLSDEALDRLFARERMVPDRQVFEIHTQQTARELDRIRRRRVAVVPEEVRADITRLAARAADGGDLQYASPAVHAEVLYWAAYLHAARDTLDRARDFREQHLHLGAGRDLAALDALLHEAEGDAEGAIRSLRDLATDEARSVLFAILRRVRGSPAALEWFDSHPDRHRPELLTAVGWLNLTGSLAEAGRWEEAAAFLAAVHDLGPDCPDLPFTEGAVSLAFLLPPELRHHALGSILLYRGARTVEGPAADRHRAHAIASFERAEQLWRDLHPPRADAARTWLAWLRVTDPRPGVSAAARREVQESMVDGETILRLLPLARAFDIPFDVELAWRYLAQRTALGGLDDVELQAQFILAQVRFSGRELDAYLGAEGARLIRAVPGAVLILARLEALTVDGHTVRARELFEGSRDLFTPVEALRIETSIAAREGADPRQGLEAAYAQTGEIEDLKYLVGRLEAIKDWSALRPRLEELLDREDILENARRLVNCMLRDPHTAAAEVVALLDRHPDFVAAEPDLQSARAWALFRTGRLREAQQVNSALLRQRDQPQDLDLDINLALASGRWEHFPDIVDRGWVRRDEHPPATLMRLASLAAEVATTSDRSWDLAKLAVTKAAGDPHIIMSALQLMYRLGRDGQPEGAAWLSQAMALSSDTGPVQRMDLATVVNEWLPAHRDHSQMVWERWLRGEIPVHVAASQLNVPLSELLIATPRTNEEQQDGRRLLPVPIASELHQPGAIQPGWALGLDATSILVLSHVRLLERVIATFRVKLAPDTLLFLLNERNRVRFHQPARVEQARALRTLLDRELLRIAETPAKVPAELAAEVGRDLAALLQAARESGGIVVRPLPIHQLSSLMTRPAELGEHRALIRSTVDLEEALFRRGHLDTPLHESASAHLRSQDRPGDVAVDDSFLAQRLYLDDLAVAYLQAAGLLPALAAANLDLRVHSSLRDDTHALISRSHGGEELAAALNAIRISLRNGLEAGTIELLPRQAAKDEVRQRVFDAVPTVLELLEDTGSCDALMIDDRFFNRLPNFIDRRERTVPVLGVLDLLRCFETEGALRPPEAMAVRHRLRRSGFVFLPLLAEELESLVGTVQWGEHEVLGESQELRCLRQYLAKLRAVPDLFTPVRAAVAGPLLAAAAQVIRKLWEDAGLPSQRAAQLGGWLWHHVAPVPGDWLPSPGLAAGSVAEALAQQLLLLLQPLLPGIPRPRQDAYLEWLEGDILEPLLAANPAVIHRLGALAAGLVERWAAAQPEHAAPIAHYAFAGLPRLIRAWLAANVVFPPELQLASEGTLTTDGSVTVAFRTLLDAGRRLWESHQDQALATGDGTPTVLTSREGVAYLDLSRDGDEPRLLALPPLALLSGDREARLEGLRQLRQQAGPTAPELTTLQDVATERPLGDDEIHQVFAAIERALPHRRARLREALASGRASLDDLVPDSWSYFERFCGPDPGAADPRAYLSSTLPNYRQGLLQADLQHGLEICLHGALRDDLCPGGWLERYGDDELWSALQACNPGADPLSLLAALDIALYRQHDARFAGFAGQAVATLLGDAHPLAGGDDFYRLFPPLAELALQRLTLLEGGMSRAPFWRRLCAWMQAALVLRLLPASPIDRGAFTRIIESNLSPEGQCAKLLDLRREPLVLPGQISAPFVRAEVRGRLWLIAGRHRAAGRHVPQAEEIDQALLRPDDQGSHLLRFMPGPLDGLRQPHVEMPPELGERLRILTDADLPAAVVFHSRTWPVPAEHRARLRGLLATPAGQDLQLELSRLELSALAAAADRDRELADAVAAAGIALAGRVREATDMSKLFHTLVIAAAAVEDEADSTAWLSARLNDLAERIPPGRPALVYWHCLDAIRVLTDAELRVSDRAAAIASAAMF